MVDSSISKDRKHSKEYTVEADRKLYELLYDLGCKGGTTYRDGFRAIPQVLYGGERGAEG